MSRVTSKEIEGYVWKELQKSDLAKKISGKVYRRGTRPRGSRAEDAVVSFTAGSSDEISEGFVTVNIFVPDFASFGNGVLVEDIARMEELEKLASEWVENLPVYPYQFALRDTIYTVEEPETREHFVAIHLRYRIYEPKK